jgi:ribonuclease P/MRP protein subunit RPP40
MECYSILHKLKDCKVLGKVGVWLAKFLDSTNRQQAVVVDGAISALSPVTSGVPQGTVLGPILFLLHIADIARGVSAQTSLKSYVDDTRVQRSILDTADCEALQADLESIYSWAEEVAMVFNGDKFEALRYWPGRTAKPATSYLDPDGNPIEEKSHLRDLGVQLGDDCTFSAHVENTVAAGNKLAGWALRSFQRRSKHIMLTIWKTMVQPKLDYCSVLWSPPDQASIARLESVARHFTCQIAGMEELDYWDRLSSLKLYSQERRRERYAIIFIWKIAQQLVKGYTIDFVNNPRRGRLAAVQLLDATAPPAVRRARECSLKIKGSKVFNLIPRLLRDMNGTVDQFKAELDRWLSSIPDQPTVGGRQRAAQTNSLLDQVLMHQDFH